MTFFVIDEFYKLDLRGDDDERSVDLNLCFHKLASAGAKFYLIGPHVDGVIGLASSYEYLFVPSLFLTVDENVASLGVELTTADLQEIQAANVEIQGARYPDEHMKLVGR
ncbi:hypothetical protein HGP14_08920 [Rhizobium sp. P32RR-XVIII]|uniref:hypothetical protein n=1 Tax=Rhizobium sp. P32RR-XVIII TaxID=2726738 RepID=UPI0014567AAD|nr:hypothetical protein [Rhizobium sp. P32RR-XVIII]NLS03484.1 hypothetical protein [Rhizobium sp. P32RR-XVIII]